MCRRKSENCQQTWLLRQCGYAMQCWLLLTTGRPRARQMINQLEHSPSALILGTPLSRRREPFTCNLPSYVYEEDYCNRLAALQPDWLVWSFDFDIELRRLKCRSNTFKGLQSESVMGVDQSTHISCIEFLEQVLFGLSVHQRV